MLIFEIASKKEEKSVYHFLKGGDIKYGWLCLHKSSRWMNLPCKETKNVWSFWLQKITMSHFRNHSVCRYFYCFLLHLKSLILYDCTKSLCLTFEIIVSVSLLFSKLNYQGGKAFTKLCTCKHSIDWKRLRPDIKFLFHQNHS